MTEIAKKSTALDAFLNLLTLITLGWFSISLGRLLFVIIEKTVGDSKDNFFYMMGSNPFSWPIASLLIITPIFLAISGVLHRQYKNNRLEKGAIYRWLTYFMLLISALVIAGDLIKLVDNLLSGDYKIDTILKILTVLVISVGIFLYYWYDLKREDYQRRSALAQVAFYGVIVVTLASIVGGFMVADSPKVAREKKMDAERVAHLDQLSYTLEDYYRQNEGLPENLSEKRFAQFVDPENKQPYEYRKIEKNSYELCATFTRESPPIPEEIFGVRVPAVNDRDWRFHEAGRQCYERKIDTEPVGGVISRPAKPVKN